MNSHPTESTQYTQTHVRTHTALKHSHTNKHKHTRTAAWKHTHTPGDTNTTVKMPEEKIEMTSMTANKINNVNDPLCLHLCQSSGNVEKPRISQTAVGERVRV